MAGGRSATPAPRRTGRPGRTGYAAAARRGKPLRPRRTRRRPGPSCDPSPASAAASAAISSTSADSVTSSAARASSQACTSDGMALAPLGVDPHLAECRDRLAGGRPATRAVHRCGERQHRVAAVHQSGGPGVIGLPAEREQPPAVRPDGRRHRDRTVEQIQCPALLDVQFDVHTHAVDQTRGPGRGARDCAPLPSAPRPG